MSSWAVMRRGVRGKTLGLLVAIALAPLASKPTTGWGADEGASPYDRYARADTLAPYVHWIDLYDANNNIISPSDPNPQPYSPERTCGRCHDQQTIAHGWHFNAVSAAVDSGRPGQPWIWTDDRTGTRLPLSYRGDPGTFNPDEIGVSRWSIAAQFGGYLPGGGPGEAAAMTAGPAAEERFQGIDRADITGPLPIDCMLCHQAAGSGYQPQAWTEQIAAQNFPHAPAVAAGLATVEGNLSRIKEPVDVNDPKAAETLPKLTYDPSRFRPDGKVFFDLVRSPTNAACYHCHSNLATEQLGGGRWLHDQDIHLRAGMQCTDCHRNALEHHTVRGFEGEEHPSGHSVATLSCRGCHLDGESGSTAGGTAVWDRAEADRLLKGGTPISGQRSLSGAGRLGAPKPLHRGLPPLHLEKLSCTACHAGPLPQSETPTWLNAFLHGLGRPEHRSGRESPQVLAPVNLLKNYSQNPEAPAVYTPHRISWPAYWASWQPSGDVTPLDPQQAYELTRRALRVRRDLTSELADVKLSAKERRELLGEGADPDSPSAEQSEILEQALAAKRQEQVEQRMLGALQAVQQALPAESRAIYIGGGRAWGVDSQTEQLTEIDSDLLAASLDPVAWPIGHDVRPARWSLGSGGCRDCHADGAPFFEARLASSPTLPDQPPVVVTAHQLQGLDMARIQAWNQLFEGRQQFKYFAFAAASLVGLCLVVAGVVAVARRVGAL
jgi:hypothetical protein